MAYLSNYDAISKSGLNKKGKGEQTHLTLMVFFIIIQPLQCFIEEKELYRIKFRRGVRNFTTIAKQILFEEIHFFFNYIILRPYTFETLHIWDPDILRTFMKLCEPFDQSANPWFRVHRKRREKSLTLCENKDKKLSIRT